MAELHVEMLSPDNLSRPLAGAPEGCRSLYG